MAPPEHDSDDHTDAGAHIAALLSEETTTFRDQLKKSTGRTLTVEDAQAAVTAVMAHLRGEALPDSLKPFQRRLAYRLMDRLAQLDKEE